MLASGDTGIGAVMSEVLVRNLEEAVVEQLKVRARGNGRSLQAELKLILEQAARRRQHGRRARSTASWPTGSVPPWETGPRPTVPRCWPRTGRGDRRRGIPGGSADMLGR